MEPRYLGTYNLCNSEIEAEGGIGFRRLGGDGYIIAGGELSGELADTDSKGGGRDDSGVQTPAQNPAFDFFEAAEMDAELATTARELGDLLAGMPFTVAELIRRPGVELDDDLVVAFAMHDSEASAEIFFGIKVARRQEGAAERHRPGNAAKRERAQVFAGNVVGEQVPAVVVVDSVIRVYMTLFDVFLTGFAVAEFEGAMLLERLSNGFERFVVGVLGRKRAEGENLLEVFQCIALFVVELSREFVVRDSERLVIRCAMVLRNGFVSNQKREQLVFGDGGNTWREGGDFFGIVVAVFARMVFDADAVFFLHVIKVTPDCFGGHSEGARHGPGIGIAAGGDKLVNAVKPGGEFTPGATTSGAAVAAVVGTCGS
jgi:hypothetical protein